MVRDRGWAVRGDTSVAGCYGSARGLTELLVALRKMLSCCTIMATRNPAELGTAANFPSLSVFFMRVHAGIVPCYEAFVQLRLGAGGTPAGQTAEPFRVPRSRSTAVPFRTRPRRRRS